MLLSTFFVSCWAYYTRVRNYVYLFGGKLLLTFIIQRLHTLFIFVTFLRFLTFFLFWENVFSSLHLFPTAMTALESHCGQRSSCHKRLINTACRAKSVLCKCADQPSLSGDPRTARARVTDCLLTRFIRAGCGIDSAGRAPVVRRTQMTLRPVVKPT